MTVEVDSFGRVPCPRCGQPLTVVTHVDRPGDAVGMLTVDVDLMPLAVHIAAAHDAADPFWEQWTGEVLVPALVSLAPEQ